MNLTLIATSALASLALGIKITDAEIGRPSHSEMIMEKFDKNGDEKLTSEEVPGNWFDSFDTDGNGWVDSNELKAWTSE